MQHDCFIAFSEDLDRCADLISVDNLTLVPFELALGHEDGHANGALIFDPLVKFALLEALLIDTRIRLRKRLINEFVASIDNMMRFDRVNSVSVPEQVHIVRLLHQDEELILHDGSDFASAAEERTPLDRLHNRSHRDCIVVLVRHDRGPLDMPSTDASRLERYLA